MNGLKEMAEQAGMHYRRIEDEFCKANADGVPMEMLEAFAKLVAAKEREACIDLIKSHGPTLANGFMLTEAIRARGEA